MVGSRRPSRRKTLTRVARLEPALRRPEKPSMNELAASAFADALRESLEDKQ